MGNSVFFSSRQRPSRGPAFVSRIGRIASQAFLCFAVLLIPEADAQVSTSGIIIYTSIDNARDETAIAVPFSRAEQHQVITNVTTTDGKTFRVTNNQFKLLVHPIDLSRATAVDDAGIGRLRSEAASLRSLQIRFPRASGTLEPFAVGIERMVQAIENGNVLVEGRLMSKAEYMKMAAASAPKSIDLTVDGRSYSGARLTSVRDGFASIMHSGGVASIEVRKLSDEQVARLNSTSSTALIDKSIATANPLVDPSMKSSPETSGEDGSAGASAGVGGAKAASPDEPHVVSIGAMPELDEVSRLLHDKLQKAARRLGDKGRHVQVLSAPEIAERTAKGVAEFLAYDVGALVASNVIDNFGDGPARNRHRELMTQLALAPSNDESTDIKEMMKEHAQKFFTGDIDQLHAFASTDEGRGQMERTMSQVMKRALVHVAFLQETRSRQSVQVSFQREMAGITILSESQVHYLQSKFDILTRMDIAEALQTGNWEGVDLSILADEQARQRFKQHLTDAQQRSGGALGRQLEIFNNAVVGDPSLSNTFSEMDERDYYRGVVPRLIEQGKQGAAPPPSAPTLVPPTESPSGEPPMNRYGTGDPELERRLIEEDRVQSRVFGVSEGEMIRMRKDIIEKMGSELSE